MTRDLVAAVRAEIACLEAELRADLRYQRLERLRSVLDLYPNATESDDIDGSSKPERRDRPSKPSGRKPSALRQEALDAARMHLANHVEPVPTREILAHLEVHGIEVGGKDPVSNLSAMLSNSKETFESHGRSGWTLRGLDETIMEEVAEVVLTGSEIAELMALRVRIEGTKTVPEDVNRRLLSEYEVRAGRGLSEREMLPMHRALWRVLLNQIKEIGGDTQSPAEAGL